MRRHIKATLGIVTAALMSAGAVQAGFLSTQAVAVVEFQGSSTLHAFGGQGTSEPFTLEVRPLPGSGDRVWSARAPFPVVALSTAHAKRDGNMQRMFESVRFPTIEGWVDGGAVPAGANSGRVEITLSMHGCERVVVADVRDWQETPSAIFFTLVFPVRLSDFTLRPPSVMGIIKVGDEVMVVCQVWAPVAGSGGAVVAMRRIDP